MIHSRPLNLSGFVLKSRSPSCGPAAVPIHREDDANADAVGRGLFAQILIEAMPNLPIVDEEALLDPVARRDFVRRVVSADAPHHGGITLAARVLTRLMTGRGHRPRRVRMDDILKPELRTGSNEVLADRIYDVAER